MTANLASLWLSFIAELECATDRWNVTVDPTGHHGDYVADEDERAMAESSDEEIMAWIDDLEHRVGMHVEDMRDAAEAYCNARKAEKQA